jgi:16S rRNA processing protein RimM
VRRSRRQGERTIVSFSEVTDRTTAESLRGRELFIATEQARDLQSGEYWDHDLIGCTVMTTTDTVVGTVTDVLHQPANEVLVVSRDGEEVLIPLVEAVVKEVEPRKRITIRPDYGG